MGHRRHDRGVGNPQIGHTMDAQPLIDRRRRVRSRTHLAGPHAMVIAVVGRTGKLRPILARPRLEQGAVKFLHRISLDELGDKLHGRNHRPEIFGVRKHLRIDLRQFIWIRTLQENPAAVSLLQEVRGYRHHPLDPLDLRGGAHDDVKIGAIPDGIFLDQEPEARHNPVLTKTLGPFKSHVNHRMVLIVLADSLQGMDYRNAQPLQLFFRPEAREHQDLRRMVNAGAKDNLTASHRPDLAVLLIADPFNPRTAKLERDDLRLVNDGEVWTPARAVEIGDDSGLAFTVLDVIRGATDTEGD